MPSNEIENIDGLFTNAIKEDLGAPDAFGNRRFPGGYDDGDGAGDDEYVVLDGDEASAMFDVIDDSGFGDPDDFDEVDEADGEEEEVDGIDDDMLDILDDGPVIERRRSGGPNVLGGADDVEDDEDEPDPAPAPKKAKKKAAKKAPAPADDDMSEVEVPDWVVSMRSKLFASVAHAFLLSGNVRDYMVRDITIKDGIVQVLDPDFDKFDVIAEYDQAHGLSFYGEEIDAGDGETLSDVYRARFIGQMKEAQERMSLPVTDDIPNRDTVMLFTVMSYLFDRPSEERDARLLLFIDYSDFLVPDASAAQMKPEERKLAITLADIGRSQRADEAGNCLIFITDDATQLSTRIRSAESRIEHIKIPIPSYEEREDFIDHVLDVDDNVLSDGTQIFEHPDSIDKGVFAVNTAGLSRIQIEDIVLRCLSEDEPLSMRIMKDRKNDIIREDYDEVLEIVDPNFGFERIGGLEPLKKMFMEEIIEPIHARELEAVPMGVLLMGPPGTSKSITISEKVLRFDPDKNIAEQTTVGDLLPGDYVYGIDGNPHMVIGVTPMPPSEIYELELTDGRIVRCSGDHYFTVLQKTHSKWRPKTFTCQEMMEKGINAMSPADERDESHNRTRRSRFHMPQCQPVEFPERNLPIDSYVMGIFLGDGCKNAGGDFILSSKDDEIVKTVAKKIGAVKYRTKREENKETGKREDFTWLFYSYFEEKGSHKNRHVKIRDFAPEYEELLSKIYCHEKYIPEEYKMASVEQRLELLQGLMDSDGNIQKAAAGQHRHNITFATTSPQLRDDFLEIIYSLGFSATWSVTIRAGKKLGSPRKYKDKHYTYKSDLYEVRINVPNEAKPLFFKLSRKKEIAVEAARHPKKRHYDRIPIKDIRPTGEIGEMRCIKTDAPDELFLVGDYVPTHNTFLSKAVAHEAGMNFVALNLNRIMEKWVGSTERNLDRALDCAMAMSPTIIFIDEIDEALPNRADPNASSVNKRVNQRLLTFFSQTEHRGQVMILAATNYPEKVDPAFKRAGRFDMRFPMFAPDEFDRMRIMQVIAKARGYSFSWFESPDQQVHNPFRALRSWLEAGNAPVNEKFVGDKEAWSYTVQDSLGQPVKHEVFLPKKLISIIDRDWITLQQLYEGMRILFENMPTRTPDASTGEIETDEVFFRRIKAYLDNRTDVIGDDARNIEDLMKRAKRWEKIYRPFTAQTFQMTGAEMDVVMNKAITLWKRWTRQHPDAVGKLIENKVISGPKDIPWQPFLLDACRKTVNAVAGIKQMEDNALLNTSDLDFIPDAMYAETDDGRQISYHERQEELVAGQTKSQLKKDKG